MLTNVLKYIYTILEVTGIPANQLVVNIVLYKISLFNNFNIEKYSTPLSTTRSKI